MEISLSTDFCSVFSAWDVLRNQKKKQIRTRPLLSRLRPSVVLNYGKVNVKKIDVGISSPCLLTALSARRFHAEDLLTQFIKLPAYVTRAATGRLFNGIETRTHRTALFLNTIYNDHYMTPLQHRPANPTIDPSIDNSYYLALSDYCKIEF